MLIEFSVGNFRSFKDIVTLSMVAAKLTAKNKELDQNTVFESTGAPPLLTSAAIYGANASGKSNLVTAIVFMRRLVLNSPKETRPIGAIDVERFRMSPDTVGKSSHFEMVFVVDGKRYRYGFEVTTERVEAEWLFYVPTTKEAKLFLRNRDQVSLGADFREGKGIDERTRPNALFLSVVAQFNGPIAQGVTQWFRNLGVASGLEDAGMRVFSMRSFLEGTYREGIKDFIKRLDLGIEDLVVEEATEISLPAGMPEDLRTALSSLTSLPGWQQYAVQTVHLRPGDGELESVEEVFDLDDHESEGTKKLFAISGPVVSALEDGKVLVIDEFDARLHPLLTREIISLFNSVETNTKHAQLIVTTHDTNLLDNRLFRRDRKSVV